MDPAEIKPGDTISVEGRIHDDAAPGGSIKGDFIEIEVETITQKNGVWKITGTNGLVAHCIKGRWKLYQ